MCHYQSTLDAVHICVVPWLEFPIVPSFPHYQQGGGVAVGPTRTEATLFSEPLHTAGAVHPAHPKEEPGLGPDPRGTQAAPPRPNGACPSLEIASMGYRVTSLIGSRPPLDPPPPWPDGACPGRKIEAAPERGIPKRETHRRERGPPWGGKVSLYTYRRDRVALHVHLGAQSRVQGYLTERKRIPLGHYRRPMPRVLGGS